MNRKILLPLLATMIVFGLLLSGCQTAAPEEAPAADTIKVALVLSGPISDASWNAAAYNSLVSLKDKFELEIEYTENTDLPDIEPAYRGYADSGFDVIIGHGFQFSDPAMEIAPNYPETYWGIVMGYAGGEIIELEL